jgi:hypothetical protein
MNKLRLAGAVILCSAIAHSAAAYTVKGHIECPDVVREHANENFRSMNMWWLLGYVTARNYIDAVEVGAGIDDEVIYEIGHQFCLENPASDWDDAGIHVYEQLK